MDFVLADRYIPISRSVYGGKMTSGPYKGLIFTGAISTVYPVGNSFCSSRSSLAFLSSYSGFLNLNDCIHMKAGGCLIATQANESTDLGHETSMFGPLYNIGNYFRFNNLISPGSSLFTPLALYGSFNECPTGIWCFNLGLTCRGGAFIGLVGMPDLKGSTDYMGFYTIDITQIKAEQFGYYYKGASIRTNYRTSEHTADQVISQYYAQLLIDLDKAVWNYSQYADNNSVIGSTTSLSRPNFDHVSLDSCFPIGDRNPNWSELARQAYNSARFFTGNGIAMIGDIAGIKVAATDTASLIGRMLNKGASAQVIAKIFLAFHYGWKLLASDCKSLSKQIKRYNSLNSTGSKCSAKDVRIIGNRKYTNFYHCYYVRDGQITGALDKLTSMLDLDLSLANIWDLVPYSFVLDWFADLSTTLESLDSYYRMTQRHKILCTGRTLKCEARFTAKMLGFKGWAGSATITYYSRTYTSDIIYPSLFLDTTIQPLQHIVEGGALIVSKR